MNTTTFNLEGEYNAANPHSSNWWKHTPRKCDKCGNEFLPKKFNQKHCPKCRREAWTIYIRDRAREKRLELKLMELTEDQRTRLLELAERQQFADEIPEDNFNKFCFICHSTKDLVGHHISYVPPEEIFLCRKHHVFLHIILLDRQKCKPYKK